MKHEEAEWHEGTIEFVIVVTTIRRVTALCWFKGCGSASASCHGHISLFCRGPVCFNTLSE